MKLRKTLIALLVMSMLSGMALTDQAVYAKEQSENTSMEADLDITEETEDNKEETAIEAETEETAAEDEDKADSRKSKTADKEKTDKKKADEAKKQKKSSKLSYTKNELKLMSCIIYCESNDQPYAGKLAVGIVVMNRKNSSSFPNTVRDVIYDPYQFTPARSGALSAAMARYDRGQFKSANEKDCIKAAKAALSGEKSVTYGKKTYNMKSFHFFSGYVSNAKLQIAGHMFK